MVSPKFFLSLLVLVLSLLAAPAARAQTPDDEPPDNPALVDVPPDNPELHTDKPLFIDPYVGVGVVGLGEDVTFVATVGISVHLRLTRHQSLVGLLDFGGGMLLNDPDEDGRGRYGYGFGLGWGVRSTLDKIRGILGIDFGGLRNSSDNVLAHGPRGVLRVEFAAHERLMVRVNLAIGPGWGESGDVEAFYKSTFEVAYSF